MLLKPARATAVIASPREKEGTMLESVTINRTSNQIAREYSIEVTNKMKDEATDSIPLVHFAAKNQLAGRRLDCLLLVLLYAPLWLVLLP
jgi:hypothetical protein